MTDSAPTLETLCLEWNAAHWAWYHHINASGHVTGESVGLGLLTDTTKAWWKLNDAISALRKSPA